jgi:hypothetical protein
MIFARRLGPGRKPRSERDAVSGMALTGDGPFDGRRFTGDLKAARRAGDRSRPLKGAQINPFPASRAACPGAAGAAAARGAVRRRIVPVNATAPAVPAPAAGRSR